MGFPLLHYAHQAIRFLVTYNAESMAPSKTCRHFFLLLYVTVFNIHQYLSSITECIMRNVVLLAHSKTSSDWSNLSHVRVV